MIERSLISLFSGAGGLDLGLMQAGMKPLVAVEIDQDCRSTLSRNMPEVHLATPGDIRLLSGEDILTMAGLKKGEAFCVNGGPPCQSFSSGGKRQSIADPRGSLFEHYVRIIEAVQPKYFIFENVSQLITAARKHRPIKDRPGQMWNLSAYSTGVNAEDGRAPLTPDELAGSAFEEILSRFLMLGYFLTFGILNAADYGVPQRRLRLLLLGSRDHDRISLPIPTHAYKDEAFPPLRPWVTLRQALEGLKEDEPQHNNYTPRFKQYFERVPPGGNWRDLPPAVQIEALGERAFLAGGGKTGFFRRLSWDEPSPTIVGKANRKSGAMCHPSEIRPLTVRECARLQGFPDEYMFSGGMQSQYLQVGNAVPVGLGFAVGQAILRADLECSGPPIDRRLLTEHTQSRIVDLLNNSRQVLRRSARNKRYHRPKQQTSLEFTL